MTTTLTDITYEKILATLPEEVLDSLAMRALKRRKRTACLIFMHKKEEPLKLVEDVYPVIQALKLLRPIYPIIQVVARYENITEEELPLRVIKDIKKIENHCTYPLHCLLGSNRDILENNDLFKEMSVDGDTPFDEYKVDQELIEHLYTKILKPEDILTDIQKIGDLWFDGENIGTWTFRICFEDELSFKVLKAQGL